MQQKLIKIVVFILLAFNLNAQEYSFTKEVLHYDKGENNWLNLYLTDSKFPTPVYIWAHPNSDGKKLPSANDMPKPLVQKLIDNKIAVISWESVPQVQNTDDLKICQEDLESVYRWIVNNGDKYNFDLNQLFIGGASRGSVIVWKFINQNPEKIKGAYLVQALPRGAWAYESINPLSYINDKSPEIILSYRDPMDTKDGHTPLNGQKIVDKYIEIGIGNRIKLYHSQGKDLYKHLIEFIITSK